MMTFKPCFWVFLTLLLTACAQPAVQNHHYFLPSPDSNATTVKSKDSRPLLQISEVQLADFLDKDGLVLQLDDITLNQAKNHQWAEGLSAQISRALRERLNQQQQHYLIVGPSTAADLRLSLEIHAFHGRYDGIALTQGQWQLRNKQGEIQQLKPFDLQTELKAPGYPALVRSLGDNLDKLALHIVEEMQATP